MIDGKEIIEGEVRENIFGNWSDVDKGIFVDTTNVDGLFNKYIGKTIKITIEIIEEEVEG